MNEKKKRTKRTPEQREAMRIAYWQKWAGTMPATVIWTKGKSHDEWEITNITNVMQITPDKSDITNI
jgi:hypothetical protein